MGQIIYNKYIASIFISYANVDYFNCKVSNIYRYMHSFIYDNRDKKVKKLEL